VWGFFGLAVPAKTPEAIVEKLNGLLLETMRRDDMRKRYADMGMQAAFYSRAEATAFIAGEIERLGPVVKAADARLE
jgi:tripartite-type tricarboxylate transporter receptor subunit TctC